MGGPTDASGRNNSKTLERTDTNLTRNACRGWKSGHGGAQLMETGFGNTNVEGSGVGEGRECFEAVVVGNGDREHCDLRKEDRKVSNKYDHS